MRPASRAVLVTGCSRGIGRATALALLERGWRVYATARNPDDLHDLERAGCRILALDVTDAASRDAAVEAVTGREGAVGVLVNNAGISELGALETFPADHVRRLFETNVFGMLALTQLVLPGMRAQRWGRVVNIGSMNGRFIWPGMGAYAATKHAIEAFSDALRYELRPLGVEVSLIAPGMVTTGLAIAAADRARAAEDVPVWARFDARVVELSRTWDSGARRRFACAPEDVADRVVRALEARRPRARYRVAPSAHLMLSLRRMLSERAFERFLRTQFPSPRRE
ncbi:SDR family oxidoreductase [Microbacter sp. GSS18]|nr:SDR family oxidoreductase [Microbacter sp. GSS18]